eukprot:Tamp_09698.p1 GENE.Tamp_09698~~Tamp_09698.p1  ORF type:complete len:542 (-),score=72.10 Tamp_09698:56-1681(-)
MLPAPAAPEKDTSPTLSSKPSASQSATLVSNSSRRRFASSHKLSIPAAGLSLSCGKPGLCMDPAEAGTLGCGADTDCSPVARTAESGTYSTMTGSPVMDLVFTTICSGLDPSAADGTSDSTLGASKPSSCGVVNCVNNLAGGGGGGGGGGGYGPQDINLGLFLGQDDRPERRAKKVFVTGATGSIGRCVVAQLLQDTQHTVYCLVRNPALLRLPRAVREQARTRLVLLIGDISDPGVYGRAAAEADCAVLLACSWGGPDCYKVNVEGTLKVINCLKSSAQVLYASSAALITADGLGGQEVQAGDKSLPWGASDYLKSKASALAALTSIGPLQPRLTVVYPSLVLGPRSRSAARRSVEEGLLPRLLVATGLASSTHFIHPTDAAQVLTHLLDRPRLGRYDAALTYVNDYRGSALVRRPGGRSPRPGPAHRLAARHFILAQEAVTTLWARCLAGGIGAGMGMVLGVAGAPTNNVVLAGWSAILWTGAGAVGGSLSAQALPASVVSAALAASNLQGPPSRIFASAMQPETFGLTSYAKTVGQVC